MDHNHFKEIGTENNMVRTKSAIPKIQQAEARLSGTCINCLEDNRAIIKGVRPNPDVIYCNNCGYWEPL